MITGSHQNTLLINVVGLPLAEVRLALQGLGALAVSVPEPLPCA